MEQNNKDPLVSVIIPAFNSEKYIADAIDSILEQTYKNLEIIIVDDGSTDNTAETVRRYISIQTTDHRPQTIRYIYQENKGPAAARNRGIKEAKGEYIAFLDSDDIWLPEKLELQIRCFLDNNPLGFIYTGYYAIDESREVLGMGNIKNFLKKEVFKKLFLKNVISTASTVMVKKECFDVVGLFDENLAVAEDWDMWWRIIKKYDFYCLSKPLVKVRIRKGSQSYYGWRNLENELKFLNKLFSDNSFKKNILLRRKSYSYRYYAAAVAYKENRDISQAVQFLFKSFLLYPISFFSKTHVCLFLYLILGEKVYSAIKLASDLNRGRI